IFSALRPIRIGSGIALSPLDRLTPPWARIATMERIRCWFIPMRPVMPFMMMPRRFVAIMVSGWTRKGCCNYPKSAALGSQEIRRIGARLVARSHEAVVEIGDSGAPDQRQIALEFLAQQRQHALDALLSAGGQRIERRPAERHRIRAECEGLQH